MYSGFWGFGAAAPGLRIRIRDDLKPLLYHLRLEVYRRPIYEVHGDLVHYDLGAVLLKDPKGGCQKRSGCVPFVLSEVLDHLEVVLEA